MKKLLGLLLLLPSMLSAQTMVNESRTSSSGPGIGPSMAFSEVEYETQSDRVFTYKRKTLGLAVNNPLNNYVSVMFQGGYNFKAEFEDGSDDGHGYTLGAGLNGVFYHIPVAKFVGYGLVEYQADSFEYEYGDADLNSTDLHVGALALFPIAPKLDVYVGLDLVPFSDGSIEYSMKYNDNVVRKRKVSFERDEMLGVKIGANIGSVRPELTLGSEKTFALTATF